MLQAMNTASRWKALSRRRKDGSII